MAELTIGQRIKRARQKLNVSQLELATKMGKPYQSIGQWERNITCPKYSSLEEIADALGISVVDLIRDDDDSDNEDEPQNATSHSASALAQPSPNFLQALLNEIGRCVRDNTEASAVDVYQTWISSISPIVQEVFDKAIQKSESDAEASHSEPPRTEGEEHGVNHLKPDTARMVQRLNTGIAQSLIELIRLASPSSNPEEPFFLTPDIFLRLADVVSEPGMENRLMALETALNYRIKLQQS